MFSCPNNHLRVSFKGNISGGRGHIHHYDYFVSILEGKAYLSRSNLDFMCLFYFIVETNEDQSDIWTMLIVSGTVGGFITLLFLSIIVTSVVCLYHLKTKNKSSAKQVSQKQPLPFHHPPPPPLPSRVAIQLSNPFVVTTNSLYENTISIQSPDVVTYSVPIFNHTLKASENSKLFEV